MSILYVYTTKEYEGLVTDILNENKVIFELNNFDLVCFKGVEICHFNTQGLDNNTRDFLIKATKYGSKIEPLACYLDSKLGFTETVFLNDNYFLHQKSFSILSSTVNIMIKRYCDLLMALLVGIIAIPIGLITAMLIKLESPGPIFFKQKRTGRYNEEFEVIKFRSMRTDAESGGAKWASKNDSRVTRVGRFIRKTRIDELPQLINVLQGDMSMIGPRPEREVFIKNLELEIPYYRFRHSVRPGITGLAQTKYPYGASVEDAFWKHKYDIFYIKNQTAWLDFKILILTVKTVFFGTGR